MKRIFILGTAVSSALISTPAYAERVTDKGWIQAGLFRPSFDSDVQVSLPNGPVEGTQINLETDLGMAKHKNIAQIEAGVRLTPRLRLEGGYIALKRKTAHELERDILWEDTLYPAHADIGSGVETDIFRVALGYSLLKNDHAEMGVRLGAHITHFDMFIEGSAMVGGQPAGQRRERKNKTLPLPNVGVFANVDISPVFSVHGGANYFALKIDDKKGKLVDLSAGVSGRLAPHIGIGARYRYVDYSLRVRDDDWRGKVDYRFYGPALFVEAAF